MHTIAELGQCAKTEMTRKSQWEPNKVKLSDVTVERAIPWKQTT